MWHWSQRLQPFLSFFFNHVWIHLFVCNHPKNSNVGVGGENEPQVVISISKQRIVRPIYLKKTLSKVSLRLFIKRLLAIMNFLLWAGTFSKNWHNDYRPLKILSLLDGDFPQTLFITFTLHGRKCSYSDNAYLSLVLPLCKWHEQVLARLADWRIVLHTFVCKEVIY